VLVYVSLGGAKADVTVKSEGSINLFGKEGIKPEGFNNKVKLTTRKSYGFRTWDAIEPP